MNEIRPNLIGLCPYMSAAAARPAETEQAPVDAHAGSAPVPVPVPVPAPPTTPALPAVSTTPPPSTLWAPASRIETVLKYAATVSTPANPLGDVMDDSLTGLPAQKFDEMAVKQITEYQERQAKAEGSDHLSRLIHRKQLFGGQAEVHWNPDMNKLVKLFDMDSQQALVRVSDASNEADPNGASMYGFALEVTGKDGNPTDILMTGGAPPAEHSQARDPQAQLDLFNMLNAPSKIKGLGRIVWHEGVRGGARMLLDVKHMRTKLDSVANLTAWSRAPFAIDGRDGKTYLVKVRLVPEQTSPGLAVPGDTSSERLHNEFAARTQRGEIRWRLDFQFAQPKIDDVHDPRENWHGPWLPAAELVIPQSTDANVSKLASDVAENTKFSVWKNKENTSTAADKSVFHPFGEINRARHAAYEASGGHRGCPFLAQMAQQQP